MCYFQSFFTIVIQFENNPQKLRNGCCGWAEFLLHLKLNGYMKYALRPWLLMKHLIGVGLAGACYKSFVRTLTGISDTEFR